MIVSIRSVGAFGSGKCETRRVQEGKQKKLNAHFSGDPKPLLEHLHLHVQKTYDMQSLNAQILPVEFQDLGMTHLQGWPRRGQNPPTTFFELLERLRNLSCHYASHNTRLKRVASKVTDDSIAQRKLEKLLADTPDMVSYMMTVWFADPSWLPTIRKEMRTLLSKRVFKALDRSVVPVNIIQARPNVDIDNRLSSLILRLT